MVSSKVQREQEKGRKIKKIFKEYREKIKRKEICKSKKNLEKGEEKNAENREK